MRRSLPSRRILLHKRDRLFRLLSFKMEVLAGIRRRETGLEETMQSPSRLLYKDARLVSTAVLL